MSTTNRSALAPAALLVALFAGAAAADPACDPLVEQALIDHAMAGAEADLGIIRHPVSGIREPLSILDLACGPELFGYRTYDIFFDPGRAMSDIMGLGGARICEAAASAWKAGLARPLSREIFRIRRPSVRAPGATSGGG